MEEVKMYVKELPLEFTGKGEVKGFLFKQINKTDNRYLYEVSSAGAVWYEVFDRKLNQYGGVSYPKAKSFGKWAWSTRSLDKALNYLAQ
jgi:hypothetical protein